MAGPKASTSARPATGLKAKQAGTNASSRRYIGSSPIGARFVLPPCVDEAFADHCPRIIPADGNSAQQSHHRHNTQQVARLSEGGLVSAKGANCRHCVSSGCPERISPLPGLLRLSITLAVSSAREYENRSSTSEMRQPGLSSRIRAMAFLARSVASVKALLAGDVTTLFQYLLSWPTISQPSQFSPQNRLEKAPRG